MTFNNTTTVNNLYPVANATTTSQPFVCLFTDRDPTPYDINYPIQKPWLNTTTDHFWFLKNFISSDGNVTANWIPISSSVLVETLTGNNGGAVGPDSNNNIDVVGDGTYITTVGTPLNNTLTIELIQGSLVASVTTDTYTSPATGPEVLPASNGEITVTGGQVAAGTTVHAIQTNAIGANEYSIQVQRSQAVASSTVGDNGVCHFDSTYFSVDANGFVTAIAQPDNFAFNYTNVTHAMSPYTVNVSTPPVDYYLSVDCSGGTVELKFPNTPTFKQLWIVKDRTGNASTNNITITTPGGANTFDNMTSYVIAGNYGAVNILGNNNPNSNGNYYEIY